MLADTQPKAAGKGRPPAALTGNAAQQRLDTIFGGPVIAPRAAVPNRPLLFRGKNAEHLWCRRCMRAFPNGTYRQAGETRCCPYADCNGHSTVDAVEWERVRGSNADYPVAPLYGTRYPMAVNSPVPSGRSA